MPSPLAQRVPLAKAHRSLHKAAMLQRLLAIFALLASPAMAAENKAPVVLAAASLQEAMTAAADAWAARRHPRPILSFAASSALARQIKAGAPADLFLSADEEWMDDVAKAGRIAPGTRATLAGNRLVLVTPRAKPVRLRVARAMPIARALGDGRLAMADPDAVPAGKYGKAALTALGVWSHVERRVVRADNVRGALALVERGEVPLGIVYATDARASDSVAVVGTFPTASHPPIRYPIARIAGSRSADAEGFRRFLLSGAGKAILARYGFTPR